MLKSKRFNASMAAVVVLAVMLAIAIATGGTLAWFASQDSADSSFTLGEPVLVEVADSKGALTDGKLNIQIPAAYLVPGMTLYPSVYADLAQSNTKALLRAKVTVTVEGGDKTNLDDETLATYAKILFDALDAKANYWYLDSDDEDDYKENTGYFYFVGNGEDYSLVMTAPAKVEPEKSTEAEYDENAAGTEWNGSNTAATKVLIGDNQIASIDTSKGSARIPFLVRPIMIPKDWDNDIATATVTIEITFEAIQDYLVNPEVIISPDHDNYSAVLTTLENAKKVFRDALAKPENSENN